MAVNDQGVRIRHGTASRRGRDSGGVFNRQRLLQGVQKIRRALRVGCGTKDRALVVLQDLDPRCDIGGMIPPNLWRQVEVGAKER